MFHIRCRAAGDCEDHGRCPIHLWGLGFVAHNPTPYTLLSSSYWRCPIHLPRGTNINEMAQAWHHHHQNGSSYIHLGGPVTVEDRAATDVSICLRLFGLTNSAGCGVSGPRRGAVERIRHKYDNHVEFGTNKTATARFWLWREPFLAGKRLDNVSSRSARVP